MYEFTAANTEQMAALLHSFCSIRGNDSAIPFRFHPTEGIRVCQMNKVQTSMCDVKLTPELFEHYRCDEVVDFAAPMSHFLSLVKNPRAKGACTFRYLPDEQMVSLTVTPGPSSTVLESRVPCQIPEANEFTIPDREWEVVIDLTKDQFSSIVDVLIKDNAADGPLQGWIMRIVVEGTESLRFRVGDDESMAFTEFRFAPHSELQWGWFSQSNVEKISNKYNLRDMKGFAKGVGIGEMVQISLSNEAPAKVSSQIGQSYIAYYLAPATD